MGLLKLSCFDFLFLKEMLRRILCQTVNSSRFGSHVCHPVFPEGVAVIMCLSLLDCRFVCAECRAISLALALCAKLIRQVRVHA